MSDDLARAITTAAAEALFRASFGAMDTWDEGPVDRCARWTVAAALRTLHEHGWNLVHYARNTGLTFENSADLAARVEGLDQ